MFWPDLVREDARLGNPSIYLAGFYTAVDAGDFSIAQCAREVLEALTRPESDRKPPVLEYKNLVFVCHSTGGIVARYMLERNKELFKQKGVGLALIASPSLGSVWANVARLAARYYNQRLALQLQWKGDALEDIHGRFRDLVDQRSKVMPGLFGMEACESKMIFRDRVPPWVRRLLPNRLKVVNTLSAGQYFGEVKVLRDTDHFSTVKPYTHAHPSHEFLVTFFQRFQEFLAERSVEQPRRRCANAIDDIAINEELHIMEVHALSLLKVLLPSEFDEVMFHYQMPSAHIPANVAQVQRAITLIEYALQREGAGLQELLDTIFEVAPHLKTVR